MLQVARLAPKLLGESDRLVAEFILSQMNKDGGFKDRSGESDLYYTVFGMESLLALQSDFSFHPTIPYLHSFQTGEKLDFVHLTCLARAWANVPHTNPGMEIKQEILRKIEQYRTLDGGYNPTPRSKTGTAYACFLALGAYQDSEIQMPNINMMRNCLASLKTVDGAFANDTNMKTGLTSPTAAAVRILYYLGGKPDKMTAQWLLERCHPQGGFCAAPQISFPDLLSTATALHALPDMRVSYNHVKEGCLDFIDSLWVNRGSFYGNWTDDILDCEYTFYGLLALGHLSM